MSRAPTFEISGLVMSVLNKSEHWVYSSGALSGGGSLILRYDGREIRGPKRYPRPRCAWRSVTAGAPFHLVILVYYGDQGCDLWDQPRPVPSLAFLPECIRISDIIDQTHTGWERSIVLHHPAVTSALISSSQLNENASFLQQQVILHGIHLLPSDNVECHWYWVSCSHEIL